MAGIIHPDNSKVGEYVKWLERSYVADKNANMVQPLLKRIASVSTI